MRRRTPYRCISVVEAEDILRRDGVVLADVRDSETFRRAHIEGARHVSMTNISTVIGSVAKDTPVLIYCYHGNASREYAQMFSDFGFSEVYSLDGGYEAWRSRPRGPSSTTPDRSVLQQWLAEQGFPPNGINAAVANGMTPLMRACLQERIDIVGMLIATGANLEARNDDGNTCLWFTCVSRNLALIDMLVERGQDIDNRNDNGATPLMYAASTGKADVVERLLARGADMSPETLDGFSAIDMAATIDCLTLLRDASRKESKAKLNT